MGFKVLKLMLEPEHANLLADSAMPMVIGSV